ncbi:hypothetical protein E2C01_040917 [Portunus trituberculatus]|uniref:Uncharacterized protein n=1 Tax=Portunus trituberculatus TaxID=210409 RepID=A0A5B7FIN7_PORTR|nr:hypothetical protein [Portunus trituberculatus]
MAGIVRHTQQLVHPTWRWQQGGSDWYRHSESHELHKCTNLGTPPTPKLITGGVTANPKIGHRLLQNLSAPEGSREEGCQTRRCRTSGQCEVNSATGGAKQQSQRLGLPFVTPWFVYLLEGDSDLHGECLLCMEVFCSLASCCDCCKALSHNQFLCLMESIKDCTERRKASSSGFFLLWVDVSQPGTSRTMQKPGQVGRPGTASPKVEMVPASSLGPTTTTCGCHASFPGTGKAVHSALGTFCTVYGYGVGNSHCFTMAGSCPTTQDIEVSICHTASMPGGQTHTQDVDGGIYHKAPMLGGQPLIPSNGFIRSTGKEMPNALGRLPLALFMGMGLATAIWLSCPATAPLPRIWRSASAMPGSQTPFQDVEAGIYPYGSHAWWPAYHLLTPGESVPGSLPLIQEVSVEAGQLAPLPGGSGVGQGPSSPMPAGHPLSTTGTCEDDEEDVPPNQGVSPFLHLIGQVKAYLHMPSLEAPSSSQLMGVERGQGSVLPCQPSLTLPWSLIGQAVREDAQCRSLKEPKPCSPNFRLFRDWYGLARSFYLPEEPHWLLLWLTLSRRWNYI